MKDIEKNDVDISKLFEWGARMTLATPKKDVDVWVRVVGDADVNKARVYALRKSAELRKKLINRDSDERIAMIPELDKESKPKVVELLLTLLIKGISADALDNLDIKYPAELRSDASLEEQEKHQAIIDGFPEYVEGLTKKAIDKGVSKERKRLNKMSMDRLEDLYVDTLIEQLCEAEMYQSFQDKVVYFACFLDEAYTVPLTTDFDDFLNLPTEAKTALADFYGTLTVDIDALKK